MSVGCVESSEEAFFTVRGLEKTIESPLLPCIPRIPTPALLNSSNSLNSSPRHGSLPDLEPPEDDFVCLHWQRVPEPDG
jgi:hypothetical protein